MIAPVFRNPFSIVAALGAGMLANPLITTVALGVLLADRIPKAKAGLYAFVMCRTACEAGLSVMVPGGTIIKFVAGGPTCQVLCAPFLTPTLP